MSEMALTPEERREQTRGALLASAEELFLEHGYHHVTLDGVAERAGMTKGAIYSNFTSKADLFFAVLERQSQATFDRYISTALGEPDLDSVIAAVSASAGPLKPDWEWSMLDVEARALAARDPDVRARLADLQRRQLAAVTQLLEDIADHLDLELAMPAEQVAILAVAATTGLADLVRSNPGQDGEGDFQALVEMIARLTLVS